MCSREIDCHNRSLYKSCRNVEIDEDTEFTEFAEFADWKMHRLILILILLEEKDIVTTR
jgi:hypothetical protein